MPRWRCPSRIEATCSRPARSRSPAPPPSCPTTPRSDGPISVSEPPTWPVGVLVAVLATAAIRVRLLDLPIDRDEGEYTYFAQLLLPAPRPIRATVQLQ